MYRLIVVDDVEAARDLLAECIRRSKPDIDVIGVFADGGDVIDFLQDNSVDIIITDIKMLDKSGLDVAEYVYRNKLKTNVIIVSAYDDFEYAKQAIKFGVFEYLNKPIDIFEVDDAIERAIENLKRNEAEEKNVSEMYTNSKMCFWEEIVLEREPVKIAAFKALYPKLDENNVFVSSCVLNIKNYSIYKTTKWNYESEKLIDAICGIIRLTLNDMSAYDVNFVNLRNGKIQIIIIKENDEHIDFNKVLSNIVSMLKLDVEYYNVIEACKISDINTAVYLGNDEMSDKTNKLFDDSEDSIIQCVEKAKEYISDNIENDIYREEISNYVGYSDSYFAKCFKERVGMSINKYIQSERIKRIILLLNTDMKIKDIANRMNYSNAKQMGRSFKTNVGMTPEEYRRNVIRKNVRE